MKSKIKRKKLNQTCLEMVWFGPLTLSHQPMSVLVRAKKKNSVWFGLNYRTIVKVRGKT